MLDKGVVLPFGALVIYYASVLLCLIEDDGEKNHNFLERTAPHLRWLFFQFLHFLSKRSFVNV